MKELFAFLLLFLGGMGLGVSIGWLLGYARGYQAADEDEA